MKLAGNLKDDFNEEEVKNYFEKEIFEFEYYHIKELVEFVKKHLTMIELEDNTITKKTSYNFHTFTTFTKTYK